MSPNDRPHFEKLYKNTSKYVEGIAGYLELGFNPFERISDEKQTEGEAESEVTINVTQPSVDTSKGHTILTTTTGVD